ncbi:MAG: EscU/YscU/HrcU family type III secretion system export apparatus switch protein [Bdellovibrionota bacterium]
MNKSRYKTAAALSYDDKLNSTPQLIMKGEEIMAEEIVKVAKRYNIPIKEDAGLARALSKLEIDQEIPEELYQAVAVILNQLDDK